MTSRTRRVRGAGGAGLLGVLAALVAPMSASAALLWTLTASPLAVATGVPTRFTLTASNMLLGRIECVVVDVPANFSISGVGVVGSTAGDSWVAGRSGNRVTVRTTSGGDRLELLDSLTFTVDASAVAAGSLAWPASAYDRRDCAGSGSPLGVPPVVVVTDPVPTTGPTATPAPTSAPTASPLPTLPQPLPTLPLPTIGLPTPPPGTPRPEPAPTDDPTPPPSASPDGGVGTASAGGGDPSPPATPVTGTAVAEAPRTAPRVAFNEPELDLDVASLGVLGGVGVWAVPAATIAGPGLIVLLWVALQAGGVSLWVPAVRRLRGDGPTPAPSPRAKVV